MNSSRISFRVLMVILLPSIVSCNYSSLNNGGVAVIPNVSPSGLPSPVSVFAPGVTGPGVTVTGPGVTLAGPATSVSGGVGCSPAWQGSTAYSGGAKVSSNNINYVANFWTQGQSPSTSSGNRTSGMPWTSSGSCSALPTVSPSPAPSPIAQPVGTGSAPAGFIFSPYKDVAINTDWNTNVISTSVTGSRQPILSAMPSNGSTLTWAFATGVCGSETWGGISPAALVSANVSAWVSAGKKYIISTGGNSGSFTCADDASFIAFVNRYNSSSLIGIDFDIEAGQTQSDIDNLVQRVIAAQKVFPNLRFSFTIGTLGGNVTPSLTFYGTAVMQSIKQFGLKNYTINLMAMDYGSPAGGNCIVGGDGQCVMGQSAVQSAIDLHNQYGVPYSMIEVTPMIGGNDTPAETFTIGDVSILTSFALKNGLAGIHFWSLDRDNDCAPGSASPICNSYGQAGVLGFTKAFLSQLGF